MVRKRKPDWEKFLDILLKQAGVRPPRTFWDLLHLLEQSLPKDTYNSKIGKPLEHMTGSQFEQFLGWFFEQQGYHVSRTKKSNDKGADLILRKSGELLVVQAKRRKNTIGIQAVQEVYAACGYYQGNRALVITSSRFSRPAINLANQLGVELWDLERLLQELHNHQLLLPTDQN